MEPEMTPEEERERTRQLLETMGRHVAMATFLPAEPATPHDTTNNGTMSFLELPGGKFLVTNYHVWDAYREERKRVSGLRLAVNGHGFERPVIVSDAELVDEDEGFDLAILRFEANDVIESVGKAFYRPKRWPLDTAREGDDVALVGFPGNRKRPTDAYLGFESVLLALTVESVSDRKVRLKFTNPDPAIHRFSPWPITEFKWGGMSGSMVYRLDLDLLQLFATGFLHAAGEGLDAVFYMGRADVIQDDGKIRR
jgi:hypothetical protein